jgi:hypothetical protein
MTMVKAMCYCFLLAIVLVSAILYAAVKASESRCADLGVSLEKETHLFANGTCYVVTQGEKFHPYSQEAQNEVPSE